MEVCRVPYSIVKRNDQFCVVRQADASRPERTLACHPTRREAEAQMRAVIAAEATQSRERVRNVHIPRDVPIEFRSASIVTDTVDFAERTIEIIVVPYEQETAGPVLGPDGRLRPELVERGAFDGIERSGADVTVNRDHDHTRTVGKVVEYRTDDPEGFVAKIFVSKTPLGDETLQLAADRVLKASVGQLVRRSDQVVRNGVRRIRRAFVDHIALLPNPAYTGAKVLAVRQEQSGGVRVVEVDPGDEAAWEAGRRIEAIASKLRRR